MKKTKTILLYLIGVAAALYLSCTITCCAVDYLVDLPSERIKAIKAAHAENVAKLETAHAEEIETLNDEIDRIDEEADALADALRRLRKQSPLTTF